jgi:trans-2,3-dihydro-3-hydroxyanthranilate isomerase
LKRRLYTLDVFTDTPFAGNPLAVITDGDGLSTAVMQDIAREMNLSETVFVQKPSSDRALARLRIFTTTQELPLAGHPVVGTWFLLAELGVVPARDGLVRVMQQTGAGILPVEIEFRKGRPHLVTMTQKPAEFRAARVSKAAVARGLGLKLSDFDPKLPIESVYTGIFNLMVPLRRRSTLDKISVNFSELRRAMRDIGVMAYCFALGPEGKAFARGMLPWEIGEDPATGSACGSLGAYLVRHQRLGAARPLHVLQGYEMGRPSNIHVRVLIEKGKLVPRVSGSAVRIFEGEINA